MSDEEKLKALLKVAMINGWTPKGKVIEIDTIFIWEKKNIVCFAPYIDGKSLVTLKISLDSLVTQWEKGEVSFIEALCDRNINEGMDIFTLYFFNSELSLVEAVRLEWNLKPTSERLDWLFKSFEHIKVTTIY